MMMSQNFNRRFSPNRRKTRVAALLHLDDRVVQTTIVDISFDGMKLKIPLAVEPGTPATVEVGKAKLPAIIHWHRDGHAGLHLLDRIDSETLIDLETAYDDLADYR